MSLSLLLSWWNLIYLIPLGVALLYLGAYLLTGVTFGDADADVHADIDTDADVDADTDLDADADADVHADLDTDADHDVGHDSDSESDQDSSSAPHAFTFFSLLGIGKIPVSLVLMILLITWGAVGIILNQLLYSLIPVGTVVGLISLPLAAIASVAATGGVARLMARYFPTTETYTTRRQDLIGSAAEALFRIDASFGMVTLRDSRGDLFQLPARTRPDAPPIEKGARVVLFEYDRDKEIYYVAPFQDAGTPSKPDTQPTPDDPPARPGGQPVRERQ